MKIRISNNSIRFRLKQPEVSQFEKEGRLEEVLAFGMELKDQIIFRLLAVPEFNYSINYDGYNITVFVPQRIADTWTGTDLVGFEEAIETGKGKTIKILVEKDFACLDKGEEENEGTYPNPKAIC